MVRVVLLVLFCSEGQSLSPSPQTTRADAPCSPVVVEFYSKEKEQEERTHFAWLRVILVVVRCLVSWLSGFGIVVKWL